MSNTEKNTVFDVVQIDGRHRVLLPELHIASAGKIDDVMQQYIAPRFPRWENTSSVRWAMWGDTDEMPNFIYRNLLSVPLAMQATRMKVKDILGEGLQYVDAMALAEDRIQPVFEAEEEDFRERNRLETMFLPQHAESNELFANAFCQYDLSRDHSKIDRLFHLETPFSRLMKQSGKTNRIEYLLYSGVFGSGEYPLDSNITTLPLYRWYDPKFFDWLKSDSFAAHTHLPTPGITYYARPTWIGLLNKNSWLDVARNVSKIVSALQRKQGKFSHQVIISDTYMKLRWGLEKWETFSAEEKILKYEEVGMQIEQMLVGVDNAGTILINYAKELNGELIGAMKVEAIDDKMKDGFWIPSSANANNEILVALGLHSSQVGLMNEGGSMGAGSGSDARVHFNSGIYRNTLEQKLLLERLNFVCRFNKWKGRYIFKQSMSVQTNENKSGMVKNNQPKSNPQ